MSNYITSDTELRSVADAIRSKSGTTELLTYPNGFVNAINSIQSGGGASAAAVNFRDYDGTIVQSYSAADFAELTAMPANPSHDGLTAQGWNWSLADAKTYVAKYGQLDIGQMYITDDGKTRVYIHLEQGRTSPMLGCCPNGTVDVDWGDGTAHDTLTGTSVTSVKWTSNHVYAAPGDYVIKLTVTGNMEFYGVSTNNRFSGLLRYSAVSDGRNNVYLSSVRKIEIGNGITNLGDYAFYNCRNLTAITIPKGVTKIDIFAINSCYAITNVNIPDTVTTIGVNALESCYNLKSVSIPKSVTLIDNSVFDSCYALTNVSIPDNVTTIGNYAFQNCCSLANIKIPESVVNIGHTMLAQCYNLKSVTIPNGVTNINGSIFANCYNLASINLPDGVTTIGGSVFQSCYNLASINLPDGVTTIGNSVFQHCYALASIDIPETVTTIGANAFQNCYSFKSINIPDSVTTIGSNAFNSCRNVTIVHISAGITKIDTNAFISCYSVSEYHIAAATPPTLASSVSLNVTDDCIIYVPYSADHSILEAYKTATNWSSFASRMQEEPV